jgi:F-type H+-transporting ATPase subunit epsilon
MLEVVVATPEKILFEGKAKSIILPGEQGVFEILSFHKPLLSRLISGKLIIDEQTFPIQRGVIGFNHNQATIIVEE